MDENKWHNRIMHLTSFSLGIIVAALAISKGLFNLMLYVMIGSIIILLFSFVYNYIRGIDYMKENHPEYKGEDMYSEDEWDTYSDLPNPKAYELKTNPDSRRLIVSAWNVGELDQMTLPPCHYGFQVYTRELSSQERKDIYDKSSYVKDVFPTDENGWNSLFNDCNIPKRAISLMWNQRSVDTFLGLRRRIVVIRV